MDWQETEKQIVPLLTHPAEWQHFRTELQKREVTMLTLIGDNPHRPYSIRASSERGGLRISGVDWRHPDAFRDALEKLLEEIDSGATAPPRRRPSRHGIGKKGRRNR